MIHAFDIDNRVTATFPVCARIGYTNATFLEEPNMAKPLDTGTGYLLWFGCVIGFCGIHRFYAGKWVTGALWLFTAGLCGVGQVIDLFLMNSIIEEGNLSR